MYPILDMSISTIIDDLFLYNMLISFFKKYNFIDKIITFTSLKIEKRRRKLLMLSFCFLPVVSVHTLRPNFGKEKINESYLIIMFISIKNTSQYGSVPSALNQAKFIA